MDNAQLILAINDGSDRFYKALEHLPDSLFVQQPSGGAWSVSQIAEHVILLDMTVQRALALKDDAGTDAPERIGHDRIAALLANRNRRVQAPDSVQPTGRFNETAAALALFKRTRAGVCRLIETGALQAGGGYMQHPYLGQLNKREWVYLMIAHADRHISQINQTLAGLSGPA